MPFFYFCNTPHLSLGTVVHDETGCRICGTDVAGSILLFFFFSSYFCAGQRLTPHNRTLEVRPGRITKKLELNYDDDCERDDTNSLLGVLMFG